MFEKLEEFATLTGVSLELMLLAGLGMGVLILVLGLGGILTSDDAASRRMRAGKFMPGQGADSVIRLQDNDPSGILKALVPRARKERSKVARKLRRAGVHSRNAVANFYISRSVLAVALPSVFVGLMFLPEQAGFSHQIFAALSKLNLIQALQILTFLMVLGFFTPALWLHDKVKKRQTQIEHGLPNTLDLLQVAVEAGLGFDAAVTRVAHELKGTVAPIAEEFTFLQLELQAGKDRNSALMDLATRCGVSEMSSFANVVMQSTQFGTSISEALSAYAIEMRQDRELRAQEKANKLPVKMSAVLAALMMPVLLMICLSPVLIRWMNVMVVD